jgi:uracil phosphoribosyltransferase
MVNQVRHPLVQHKLTLLRSKETKSTQFRQLVHELAMLMTYEITRDLPTELQDIETPLAPTQSPMLSGHKPVLVSILRAGNGLLEGCLQVMPEAKVGHIGLYRDPETLQPIEYYYKMPKKMALRNVIVVDPMLATGHSAVAALTALKQRSTPKSIQFLCLVAAPEGIAELKEAHPDVLITTAAIDPGLNEKSYIVPGLGDAGDRIYGTL